MNAEESHNLNTAKSKRSTSPLRKAIEIFAVIVIALFFIVEFEFSFITGLMKISERSFSQYESLLLPNGLLLVLLFLVIPAIVLYCVHVYGFKKADSNESQSNTHENNHEISDKTLLLECKQAIRYFGLKNRNLSNIPLSEFLKWNKNFGKIDPKAPQNIELEPISFIGDKYIFTAHDNLAVAISTLEIRLDDRMEFLQPQEKASLYLIHDCLSTMVSESDDDIAIDSLSDVIESGPHKRVSFNYFFGTVYVFALCILYHSLMFTVHADIGSAKSELIAYDSIMHSISKIVKQMNTLPAGNYVLVEDSVISNTFLTQTTLLHDELLHRIVWLHSVSTLSPIPIRMIASSTQWNERLFWYKVMPSVKYDDAVFLTVYDTSAMNITPKMVSIGGEKGYWKKFDIADVSDEQIYTADRLYDILSQFILPMLYGMAGAFLWVIRRIAEQVKAFDMTWKDLIRHRARIIFGLFVGMFFGYLYPQNSIADVSSYITPYVLAFVGGYNVEILFSALDSLVKKFTPSSDEKAKAKITAKK